MSLDYGISTNLSSNASDTQGVTTAEVELGNVSENGSLNWELAWIDLGGEG